MKLWIDDVRPAPKGYIRAYSVNDAKYQIMMSEDDFHGELTGKCELLDIDYDAGDFYHDGGDYIKLLDWLEETGRNYPIRIHSMNVVGVKDMRTIIKRNNWKEVF